MTLQTFGLTAEQKLLRLEGLGGSDANTLMSGDPARILGLWEEKTGQVESENLDDILPVQMGNVTEDFNRYWFTRRTGKAVTRARERVVSQSLPFMMCNLDGVVVDCPDPIPAGEAAYFDAKHVNQYSKIDTVVQKYMGQMHHNGHVLGMNWAILSVFIGTMNYEWVPIQLDPFYTATLIETEKKFWECVQTMTPPNEMPAPISPAQPVKFRTVDMTGNNHWAVTAETWRTHKGFADLFEKAAAEIKGAMEFDVAEASGHGVKCTRAKNGALTIREMKQ